MNNILYYTIGHTFPGSVESRLMVSNMEYIYTYIYIYLYTEYTNTNTLIRKRGSVITHLMNKLFLKVYLYSAPSDLINIQEYSVSNYSLSVLAYRPHSKHPNTGYDTAPKDIYI